jgi:hypothetical protein
VFVTSVHGVRRCTLAGPDKVYKLARWTARVELKQLLHVCITFDDSNLSACWRLSDQLLFVWMLHLAKLQKIFIDSHSKPRCQNVTDSHNISLLRFRLSSSSEGNKNLVSCLQEFVTCNKWEFFISHTHLIPIDMSMYFKWVFFLKNKINWHKKQIKTLLRDTSMINKRKK